MDTQGDIDLETASVWLRDSARFLSRDSMLYLDLLKRSLTNTIFQVEPDVEDDVVRYVNGSIMHYQESSAVSMVPTRAHGQSAILRC